MIVRKLEAADIEQVADIEQACFSTPWSKQGFEDILFREDVLFLVACEGDEVLGYVGVYCSFDEGEITNVAVALDKRRQKVAEHLLDGNKKEFLSETDRRCVDNDSRIIDVRCLFIRNGRNDAVALSMADLFAYKI